MAVPTHSNNKPSSMDSMGVPVLFSVKNVQPLILAAKPSTDIGVGRLDTHIQPTSTPQAEPKPHSESKPTIPGQMVSSTTEHSPKARRSVTFSKAVATGFVIMLVVLVIRFSVPGPKVATDISESTSLPTAEVSSGVAPSIVTGPEPSPASDTTRFASLPTAKTDLSFGNVEIKAATNDHDLPTLPPLLTVTNTNDVVSEVAPTTTATAQQPTTAMQPSVALQQPVASPDMNAAPSNSNDATPTLEPLNLSSVATPEEQTLNASSVSSNPADNLHVLDTLTPERSLAEFEWLFRNATKNPVIPYRPVSAGGHTTAAKLPMTSDLKDGNMPQSITDPRISVPTTSGYQPITIPASDLTAPSEKTPTSQPTNRYQPIRQPQKSQSSDLPVAPAPSPYQPLVLPEAPPSGVDGTSYGYPPVQYPSQPTAQEPTGSPSTSTGQQ